MLRHHSLPQVDPFSSNIKDFVFVSAGQPIMQHEWLSDLIFYLIFSLGGAASLLAFVAAISALALIVIPSFWLKKSHVPRLTIVAAIVCTLPASSFRLWARPEVLSFLCFSLLIPLLRFGRETSKGQFYFYSAAVFLLFAFWANCHALFVLGLSYACLDFFLLTIQYLLKPSQTAKKYLACSLGLTFAAFCGSLFNPWRWALWQYIFNIVTSSASHSNKENGPLTLASLGEITVVPLVVSFIFIAALFIAYIRRKKPPACKVIPALGLYLAALVCALLFRRFSPFALLILLSSLSALSHELRTIRTEAADKSFSLWHRFVVECQFVFAGLRLPGPPAYVLGIFLVVSVNWISTTFLVKADIPSASRFFQPPWQALRYLQLERPHGRMLNDSKIGSMLTFCLANPPDIFIDGRFDSYGRSLIADYECMRLAGPGYKELLQRYRIGWIFFPPGAPLVNALSHDPSWSQLYRDSEAVILSRTQ